MKTGESGKTTAFAAFAASGLLAGGLVGVVGAGTAAADPVSITLKYTCPFPVIGQQPLSIKISTDIPKSIPVGQPTPKLKIDAVATVNDAATNGMNLVGAKTLEGKAVADATAQVPEGQLPVKTPVTLETTDIPAQGEFQVNSHGEDSALTFTKPGKGTITVGDLQMTMTPKDKGGNKTALGTFESACKQDSGQKNKLAEFEITGSGGSTGSTMDGGTAPTGDLAEPSAPTGDLAEPSAPTGDPAETGYPTGDLAKTGSFSSAPLIGAGAAMFIVAGGGIVWTVRKRSSAQH